MPGQRPLASILPFYLLMVIPAWADESPPVINSVIVGGARLPVNLATQAGRPYDAGAIAHDLHQLWATGRFDDVRVETETAAGGLAVRFLVTQSHLLSLHEIRIEPSSFGLHPKLAGGTPLHALRAHEIALEARRRLQAEGYVNARVDARLVPISRHSADLLLTVHAGKPVDVQEIEFRGHPGLADSELRGALRSMRIRRVLFWRMLPAYSPDALESDLNRLRSLYISKGYFDATARADAAEIDSRTARVRIELHSGPLYPASGVTVTGIQPGTMHVRPEALCGCLFAARRDAERQGILDFSARLNIRHTDPRTADLYAVVETGARYRVGRIEFTGSHRYTEASLRRNFLIDEAQLFDRQRLRRSLDRLNQTLQFQPIDEHGVTIREHPETALADISLSLTERKPRAWFISGPVGPVSLAGPLAASVSSRFPPWGKGLLELSTYSASMSLMAFAHPIIPVLAAPRLRPVLALQRPFTPGEGWQSGFTIAPQLGWQRCSLAYALNQLQNRLNAPATEPELLVPVERPQGPVTLICEPLRPRPAWRRAATVALRFLGAAISY